MSVRCFVALGANLGDPVATVNAAIDVLRALPRTRFVAASSLYRTAPVGLKHQPDFINAVVEVRLACPQCDALGRPCAAGEPTRSGAPRIPCAVPPAPTFLQSLFEIEAGFGRQRSVRNAPRTLDLDLLLYGELVSDDPSLTLPHPRLHERAFVLAPLAELAPDLAIPGRGAVADLLSRCGGQRIERIVAVPLTTPLATVA